MSAVWEKPDEAESMISNSEGDVESSSDSSDYEMNDSATEGGTDMISSLEESFDSRMHEEKPQGHTINHQQLVDHHHLKRRIDDLQSEVQKKEEVVNKLRKQSIRCQEQQANLNEEKKFLEEVLPNMDKDCLGMVHGRISKLVLDMDTEKDLEEELRKSLSKAEEELLDAQIAVGRYDHFKEKLERIGAALRDIKGKKFTDRMHAEARLVENARRKEVAKERQRKIRHEQAAANAAVEEGKRVNREEKSFLMAALSQHRGIKRKEEEERQRQKRMEKRMKVILNLKDSLSNIEGAMQARQILKKKRERKEEMEIELEKKRILENDGIPEEHFLRKKRLEEFQEKVEDYKKKHKERRLDIVEKLVREEKLNKQDKTKESLRKPKKKRILTAPSGPRPDKLSPRQEGEEGEDNHLSSSDSSSDSELFADCEHTLRDKALSSIIEPEIRGLWEKTSTLRTRPVSVDATGHMLEEIDDADDSQILLRPKKPSKAELRILAKAMEKLKSSKVQEQVAAGRRFKGKPYSSKPHVIVFRNFDVGKLYSKKVKLTNISYTVNRLQLEGISTSIADFVTVSFEPPGPMSAGMSCSMQVSFAPQLNEDVEGEIEFMSQTGPYSVAVKCMTKKCLVSLVRKELEFGALCVGETNRLNAVVLNAGALSTEYTITPVLPPSTSGTSILKQKQDFLLSYPTGTAATAVAEEASEELVEAARLARRSNYSIMTAVDAPTLPDSSSGLGVIPPDSCAHRLKSKSIGPITISEPSTAPHSVFPALEKAATTPENQADKRSQGKSRPKKHDTPKRAQAKKQDTPSILLEKDKSTPPQPDAQQPSQHLPMDQEPMIQDAPQPMSQDTAPPLPNEAESQESPNKEDKHPVLTPHPTDVSVIALEGAVEHTAISPAASDSIAIPTLAAPLPSFKIGGALSGWIPPFGSQDIELVFTPTCIGQHTGKFRIAFSHHTANTLDVITRGCGIEVPVYVKEEPIDLRICMLDRLYQSSVVLCNRVATALQVTFQIPPDLQPYLEVLPKHGIVQGDSSFAAQVKFKAQESLLRNEIKNKYYTVAGDRWRFPVRVGVANQFHPVEFSVLAHVTPSDLTFYPNNLDFDYATIHEAVYCSLTITNSSILPQTFGFLNIPQWIDIQPNDGFGELLPTETLELEVIFKPKKAKEYKFDLICKSGLDKQYRLECHGCGVLPPLELSHNSINFASTPLANTSTVRITITNPKLKRLCSAVIRGSAPPQGPKAFHFSPLPGSPFSFSPRVGVVPLGKSMNVLVQFSPKLSDETIREECVRLANEEKGCDGSPQKRKQKRSLTQASPLVSSHASLATSGSQPSETCRIVPVPPEKGSEAWEEAYRSLVMSFADRCMEFSIPCFVSDTVPSNNHTPLTYRPEHTMYLQVTGPVVKPSLLLEKGQSPIVDFGSIGTGDATTKKVTVLNITSLPLRLWSSILDPCGPFQLRNALRPIPPLASHDLLLWFSPQVGGKIYDSLVLYDDHSQVMELRLVGIGIHPQIDLSLGSGKELCLDMGHAMAKDVLSKTFSLLNTSPINVRYQLSMESHARKKGTLHSIANKSFKACNYNGQPAFVCVPSEGVVSGAGSKEVRVFFSPDHQSKAYADKLTVYFNDKVQCNVVVAGKAWTNNMYVHLLSKNGMQEEFPADDKESMIPVAPSSVDSGESTTHPLLVMFIGSKDIAGSAGRQILRREIEIGCVKSTLVKKMSGEFSIDTAASANPSAKSFTFDITKGTVEAGASKTVSVTFSPPKDMPCSLVAANVSLTLKGNITQTFQLLLRALVCE